MSCLRAAHWYADHLGPVHPCSRRKLPMTEHGVLDATCDHAQIDAWWRRWPTANPALACARVFCLDVDPRNGGDVSLDELQEQHGKLPDTVEQLTPSGGRHLLFAMPEGIDTWRKTLAPGIDIQAGPGKYVLLKPSVVLIEGRLRSYEWELSSRPDETPLAEVPSWVLRGAINWMPSSELHPTGPASTSLLGRAFILAGWAFAVRPSAAARLAAKGALAVTCPWQSEHTGAVRGSESSTVILPPTERYPAGYFACAHTGHGRKTLEDVCAVLPEEAIRAATAEVMRTAAEAA